MKHLISFARLCSLSLLLLASTRAQTTFAPPSSSSSPDSTAPISSAPTSTVAIVGRVVNGTQSDEVVPNVTVQFVRAVASVPGGAPIGVAKTQSNGVFRSSLNLARNDLVFARIDWQGYPYLFPVYDGANQLGANIDPRGQTLRLFDTTTRAPRELFVMSHQIMLQNDGNKLHVTEEVILENPSKQTFIGAKEQENITFSLSLPEGAEDLSIDTPAVDAQLITLGTEQKNYAIAKPILPQSAGGNPRNNALTFSYHLPWKRQLSLSRKLLYPVKYLAVVRAQSDEDKIVVVAPQLGEAHKPAVPMGMPVESIVNAIGRPMQANASLESGTILNLQLTRPTKPLIWVFIGLTALLCAFLPAAMWWSRKSRGAAKQGAISDIEYSMSRPTAETTSHANEKSAEPSASASVYTANYSRDAAKTGAASELDLKAQQLIEEIAALDDAFDEGEITRDNYQSQRAARKKKLLAALNREV